MKSPEFITIRTIILKIILLNLIWGVRQVDALVAVDDPVQIVHFPVTKVQPGKNVPIKATIDGATRCQAYFLYFRKIGTESYQQSAMKSAPDGIYGLIPAKMVTAPGIEYFISAVTNSQKIITSPAHNSYYAPYRIRIEKSELALADLFAPEKKQASSAIKNVALERASKSEEIQSTNEFLILSPEEGQIVQADEVLLAISFIGDSKKINWKSFRVYLNKKNITRYLSKRQGLLTAAPQNLSAGDYVLRVVYKYKDGSTPPPIGTKFTVLRNTLAESDYSTSPKEYAYNGNIYIDLKQETSGKRKLETNNLGGHFWGRYKTIKFNSQLFITSREKPNNQPRNRFLLGAENPWAGIYLGDTNPRFQDLILWGKRVRGVQAFLKTGYINLELVTGEIHRGIKGVKYTDFVINPATKDTVYYNPYTIPADTVNDGTTTEYFTKPPGYEYLTAESISKYGTYQRLLTGLRTSFGSGQNFQWGFTYMKAKDQLASIDAGWHPKDNLVFGSDLRVILDNQRIEFYSGIAFSLLTDDISTGTFSKLQVDTTFNITLPFDPALFEKYITVNETTTPLDPSGMSSLAYNTSLRLSYFNNNLEIHYKSIGPEFNSLGNTFLKKDIRGFSIADRVRLYQNRLLVSLEYSRYEDNFFTQTTPTIDMSSFNMGLSLFLPANYPKLSLNYRLQNHDNGVSEVPVGMTYDLRVLNTSNDFSLMLGYDVKFLDANHALTFSIFSSSRIDGFERPIFNTKTAMKMLSVHTRYHRPLSTTLSYAYTDNSAMGGTNQFNYQMFDARADYVLFNEKLKCWGGFKRIAAHNLIKNTTTDDQYSKNYWQLGVSVQINRQHSALLDSYFINAVEAGGKKYTDNIIQIRYDFRF